MSAEDRVRFWRIEEDKTRYFGSQIHILRHEEPIELTADNSGINPDAGNINNYVNLVVNNIFVPHSEKGPVVVSISSTGLERTDSTAWEIFEGLNQAKEDNPGLDHVKILLPRYLNELHTAGNEVKFNNQHVWNPKVRPLTSIVNGGVPAELAFALWAARQQDVNKFKPLLDEAKLKQSLEEIKSAALPSIETVGIQMARLIKERDSALRLALGYENPGQPPLLDPNSLFLEVFVAHDINAGALWSFFRPDEERPMHIPFVSPLIAHIGRPDNEVYIFFPDKRVVITSSDYSEKLISAH